MCRVQHGVIFVENDQFQALFKSLSSSQIESPHCRQNVAYETSQTGCMSTAMMTACVNRWEYTAQGYVFDISNDIGDDFWMIFRSFLDDFWMIAIVENAAQHDTTGET